MEVAAARLAKQQKNHRKGGKGKGAKGKGGKKANPWSDGEDSDAVMDNEDDEDDYVVRRFGMVDRLGGGGGWVRGRGC